MGQTTFTIDTAVAIIAIIISICIAAIGAAAWVVSAILKLKNVVADFGAEFKGDVLHLKGRVIKIEKKLWPE